MLRSMRSKIIITCISITILPVIVLTFIIYRDTARTLEKSSRESSMAEMVQIDRAILSMLKGLEEDCRYLSVGPFMGSAGEIRDFYNTNPRFQIPAPDSVHERIYQDLRQYGQQHPDIVYAYLGTESGGFIGWPRRDAQKGIDPRVRPWYAPAIANPGQTILSDPYRTYDGSAFTVTASHVVKNSAGDPIGVLGIDINLEPFTQTISNLRSGETGYIFMLDKNGRIMAHKNQAFNGCLLSELTGRGIKKADGTLLEWDFPDAREVFQTTPAYFTSVIEGRLCLVTIYPSATGKWSLVSVIEEEEIAGKLRKRALPLLGAVLLLSAISSLLIYLISQRLTKRMEELVRHLKNIAAGDFSQRLPEALLVSGDETAAVAKAIDDMQLRRQKAELDLQMSNTKLSRAHQQLSETETELRQQVGQLHIKTDELLRSEERYQLIIAGSKDAIWDWDIKKRKITLVGKWTDQYHLSHISMDADMFSPSITGKIHPEDRDKRQKCLLDHLQGKLGEYNCEYRITVSGGELLWVQGRGKALFDEQGNPVRMAGSLTNITERKKQSIRIHQLAYYDALTALPNRQACIDKLEKDLGEVLPAGFALLLIDIDNFKIINESMGHEAGDQFLRQVAALLKKEAPDQFAARLGGDEFILLLSGAKNRDDIDQFAHRLVHLLEETVFQKYGSLQITLSMGIVRCPSDGRDTQSLLKKADMAINSAKKHGKNRYEFFSAEMEEELVYKIQLEKDLRQALRQKDFSLYYQPIVNQQQELSGFEVLIRWKKENGEMIPPAVFIPVAEECNLIVELGHWILQEACRFGRKLQNMGLGHIHLSVNVSVKEWLSDDFVQTVLTTLEREHFPKQMLTLEIVETILIENFQIVTEKMQLLQEQGIRISLDDFGTGYSSLTYLSKLPVNTVKIDKFFIDALPQEKKYISIVRTVIDLSHEMGFDVVSEGVESEAQMQLLRTLNCDKIQGYFISRPLPEAAVLKKYGR